MSSQTQEKDARLVRGSEAVFDQWYHVQSVERAGNTDEDELDGSVRDNGRVVSTVAGSVLGSGR